MNKKVHTEEGNTALLRPQYGWSWCVSIRVLLSRVFHVLPVTCLASWLIFVAGQPYVANVCNNLRPPAQGVIRDATDDEIEAAVNVCGAFALS